MNQPYRSAGAGGGVAFSFIRNAGRGRERSYRSRFAETSKAPVIAERFRHCIRHLFASRLVMAGVDILSCAVALGQQFPDDQEGFPFGASAQL